MIYFISVALAYFLLAMITLRDQFANKHLPLQEQSPKKHNFRILIIIFIIKLNTSPSLTSSQLPNVMKQNFYKSRAACQQIIVVMWEHDASTMFEETPAVKKLDSL